MLATENKEKPKCWETGATRRKIMGIADWLYSKKQEKTVMQEFAEMMVEHDLSPLPEGKLNSSTGEMECPFCGYTLSLIETIEGRTPGAVGETDCPKCGETFKQ
jgi:hypothetical protein